MRKTLLTLLTVVVLAGLFAGSWYVTGMLRDSGASDDPVPALPLPSDGTETTIAGNGGTAPVVAAELSLPYPKNLAELDRYFTAAMSKLGANTIASTRIFTYAGIASYETSAPAGAPTFISDAPASQDAEQGMLAAGAVISALLNSPQITELIAAWPGTISDDAKAVASNVVAFANADGYDATASAVAPTFEGDLAWKPGGKRDGRPDGYEPGYGQVKTVRLDLDSCPVAPADLAAIAAERSALTSIDSKIPAPVVARPERFSLLAYIYIAGHLSNDQKAQMPLIGQTGTVMLHDALIATWRANWANGVASPSDIYANGDTALVGNYPSYPSWTEVAVSATETFVNGMTGKNTNFDEIVKFVSGRPGAGQDYVGLLEELLQDVENARSSTNHWKADVAAGRALGTCVANASLKTLGK